MVRLGPGETPGGFVLEGAMRLEKIAPYTYRIPKQGKMRVDAVFFASEEILKDLEGPHNLLGPQPLGPGKP